MKTPVAIVAGLGLLVLAAGEVLAAVPVTINKIPYTITKPGQYQLARSFDYTGSSYAIAIQADDVSIDLRGYALNSPAATSRTAETAGIFANTRKNITIRNGTVRGFFRGIYLEGNDQSGGHLVENVRTDHCTFLGIQVKGRGSIVQRNRVTSVNGSVSYSLIRYGMSVMGAGVVVRDNDVFDIYRDPVNTGNQAYGIYVHDSTGAHIEGNRVTNSVSAFSGNTFGIAVVSSGGAHIRGNFVCLFNTGIFVNNSIEVLYRDNSVTGNGLSGGPSYNVSGGASDGGGNQPRE